MQEYLDRDFIGVYPCHTRTTGGRRCAADTVVPLTM
jgi:hypothetical protein